LRAFRAAAIPSSVDTPDSEDEHAGCARFILCWLGGHGEHVPADAVHAFKVAL
jgi:hypothetical protein